jgi:hypothetical protein
MVLQPEQLPEEWLELTLPTPQKLELWLRVGLFDLGGLGSVTGAVRLI